MLLELRERGTQLRPGMHEPVKTANRWIGGTAMTFTTWDGKLTEPVKPERDHIRGSFNAPATLVEYGDYQCPFCGTAHLVVEAVRETLGNELCFAFRHFPLTTVHPYALGAAEAAEAAGAQGKFWPMHDLLFEDQDHLAPPDLVARARVLGLDIDRFENDLRGDVYHRRVQTDFLSGVRSGVQGTPTFFVNGVRYAGEPDYQSLLAALQVAAKTGTR
jgi:protein-disulfide isomerase